MMIIATTTTTTTTITAQMMIIERIDLIVVRNVDNVHMMIVMMMIG